MVRWDLLEKVATKEELVELIRIQEKEIDLIERIVTLMENRKEESK